MHACSSCSFHISFFDEIFYEPYSSTINMLIELTKLLTTNSNSSKPYVALSPAIPCYRVANRYTCIIHRNNVQIEFVFEYENPRIETKVTRVSGNYEEHRQK